MELTNSPVATNPLLAYNLSRVQLAILECMLGWDGIPKKKDVADALGLDYQTVVRAFRDPAFQRAYQGIVLSVAGSELGEVMQSTVEQAKSGSEQHQKIYYKLIGMLSDSRGKKEESAPVEKVNTESIRARKEALEKELHELYSKEVKTEQA